MRESLWPAPWPALPERAPAPITLVGLGPGSLGDLTLDAWRTLVTAPRLLLRTERHPCVAHLPPTLLRAHCDDLYEQHTDFAAVYSAIVERVFALAKEPGGIVYAVPGHPWVGEATTRLVVERAAAEGIAVDVIGGMSFVAPSFAAVGVDLMDGAQVTDAMLLAQQRYPQVEVELPLLIAQVYARWLASDLKLTLLNAYSPDHPIRVVQAAGSAQQVVLSLPLHALDTADHFDHLTSVYVAPQEAGRSFSAIQAIVTHLRAPDGCPWDREQTLASLRSDLLSECAEVLEAIDAESDGQDNGAHIAEELGDLLMAATMMVQIATEEGRFQMGDCAQSIVTKLIRRHPHVFGDVKVDDVRSVLVNWDAIKAQERAAKGIRQAHPLDGVPAALPALEKARQLQSKAQKAGLLDRYALAHENPALSAAVGDLIDEEQIGRLLWQIVALAREHGIVAEDALRSQAVAFYRAHVLHS